MNLALPSPNPPAPLEDQIREAAYFQWLDRGCPVGDDWSHWFAAEIQLRAPAATPPAQHVVDPRSAAAAYSPTPLHLHATAQHDHRPEIMASGAVQRTRARHSGKGSRGNR